MEPSLTRSSYDGEADDPAPPAASEPEVKQEPQGSVSAPPEAEVPQQQEAAVKTEQDYPMQEVKQEFKQEPAHDDDYDKPLHIKDDGYVQQQFLLSVEISGPFHMRAT